MPHRTSAAALHAAREVLKHYSLEVIPPETLPTSKIDNLQATEKCIAILIDYSTNIYHLANLRPELRYWQKRIFAGTATASGIATFFKRVLDTFEFIPKEDVSISTSLLLATPPEFGKNPLVHILSKASKEASRTLFYYYKLVPKAKDYAYEEIHHRNNVAKIVDISLELARVMNAQPLLKAQQMKLTQGKATIEDIKSCLRKVGIYLEYLPGYSEREEESKLL